MEQLSSELSASEKNGHKPRPSTEFEGDLPKSWMIVGYNFGLFSPSQTNEGWFRDPENIIILVVTIASWAGEKRLKW